MRLGLPPNPAAEYAGGNGPHAYRIGARGKGEREMSPEVEAEIKAFVKERDEMLIAGDIDRMMAFHAKHNPGRTPFPNREVAEISLHKARTGALSLPIEVRL